MHFVVEYGVYVHNTKSYDYSHNFEATVIQTVRFVVKFCVLYANTKFDDKLQILKLK